MGALDLLHEELRTASAILEWEMGDIWGHVAARTPNDDTITAKLMRVPQDPGVSDWMVRFDYGLNKLSGVGTVPTEAAIYSEIFKARPDVAAAVHSHAPMCVALSLGNKPVYGIHQQSRKFGAGVPIYPDPIFIIDPSEGADLARALGDSPAIMIKGHGIVTVGRTVDEACMTAMYLERTAKIQAMAHSFGFTAPTPEFLEKMNRSSSKREGRAKEIGRPAADYSYEWQYYADKVKKGERWHRGWT